jgi:hypothetical protein
MSPPSMNLRLHRQGRFRRWLGAQFGHDEAWGDRALRRIVHTFGAAVLIYYMIPTDFFVIAPKEYVLLAALAVVLVLETLRHVASLELPTIRQLERRRVASFAFYAVALVGAILLAPLPIAAAVILGTAFVDPLAGSLRESDRYRRFYPALPFGTYAALAFVGLAGIGGWPELVCVPLALLAAAVGVAAEYPKMTWLDDDLLMTAAPAVVLYVVGVLALGLPR